ncbi:HlyD family secretion protein [Luteibacter yeojuensis]|uniref:HlyD family efflux transporter periplasmic adaptor subunit n=1 Tax=Luteibacter yeojuensis TaxID=345309 RepID=A0A7X5QXD5_9GAMM|nr:HlyD family efflux transporter periplasmic adaptor subunit [Luteibacter yeojuensis]NID17170.1 HlyD family efflux transporter periplasmic adaptor subunit [Luteibacter yeojuensis]
MISLPLRRGTAFASLLALLLGACSRPAETAAPAEAPRYAAVARGRVDVEGGVLDLTLPREGVVADVDVHEGDHVRRGQVLAALDREPARLAIAAAQAEVDQARAQLGLLRDRLAGARRRAGRLAEAERDGAGDGQSADDARDAARELGGQYAAAKAGVAAAEQKLAAARFEASQGVLRAPVEADVVRVAIHPGISVSPQSGVSFTLLPRTARIVRAELGEAYVDAVRPGSPALVTADASAQDKPWPAHVLRIGPMFGTSKLEDDPEKRANSRTVECVLAFDGTPTPRVGERVIVRFGAAMPPSRKKGR